MSAAKNSNVREIGCLSKGYFAKVYRDAVQIFDPTGAPYCKLFIKSTFDTEYKAKAIIAALNAALDDTAEDTISREVIAATEAYERQIKTLQEEIDRLKYWSRTFREESTRSHQVIASQARALDNLSSMA